MKIGSYNKGKRVEHWKISLRKQSLEKVNDMLRISFNKKQPSLSSKLNHFLQSLLDKYMLILSSCIYKILTI